MRTTGLAVLGAGILIGLFAAVAGPLITSRGEAAAGETVPVETTGTMPDPVLLAFAVTAVLIGGAIYLFGGRSYIKTRNPAVRN